MRTTLLTLTLLALPALAAAQEPADLTDSAPSAALEVSVDRTDLTAPDFEPVDPATERDVENRSVPVEDRSTPVEDAAAAQDLGDRGFWKIVLAVVVGGVILAVLL